jgi:hypothetical protein
MKPRSSTIICWVLEDSTGIVTADQGDGEALIVFRDLREARDFQWRTATQDCELVGKSLQALRALLDKYDLGWVAAPAPRTGEHLVDLFTARAFIEMLDEELE